MNVNFKNLCITFLVCALTGAVLGALGMGTLGCVLGGAFVGGLLSFPFPILE